MAIILAQGLLFAAVAVGLFRDSRLALAAGFVLPLLGVLALIVTFPLPDGLMRSAFRFVRGLGSR